MCGRKACAVFTTYEPLGYVFPVTVKEELFVSQGFLQQRHCRVARLFHSLQFVILQPPPTHLRDEPGHFPRSRRLGRAFPFHLPGFFAKEIRIFHVFLEAALGMLGHWGLPAAVRFAFIPDLLDRQPLRRHRFSILFQAADQRAQEQAAAKRDSKQRNRHPVHHATLH